MNETTKDLRAWAEGTRGREAAVELLAATFVGRFARPGQPWIKTYSEGSSWLDGEAIPEAIGALSSGEQRVLLIAASLAAGEPVALDDVLSGHDPDTKSFIIKALTHAIGIPQDWSRTHVGEAMGRVDYQWAKVALPPRDAVVTQPTALSSLLAHGSEIRALLTSWGLHHPRVVGWVTAGAALAVPAEIETDQPTLTDLTVGDLSRLGRTITEWTGVEVIITTAEPDERPLLPGERVVYL